MYDDGGISGGTMERPALKRLLEDVKSGKINIIVVYKVDRLTRSLADFAKIVDILDHNDASFVSVTQQFNTTTSMGRLTLNMLLSFAQFEREIAGERIRDKIAASKRKGMWMGGNLPLGYDVSDRKLIINEQEAQTVRHIFRRYSELGSVRLLKDDLNRHGIVSKKRESASGILKGAKPFSRGALYLMLQNRIYRGEISHKGETYPGQHDPIIEAELWDIVQEKLAANRNDRLTGVRTIDASLLTGLIFDERGERLTPSHATKGNKRYRYYISTDQIEEQDNNKSKAIIRIPAGDIESLVLRELRVFLLDTSKISEAFASFQLDANSLDHTLKTSEKLAHNLQSLSQSDLKDLLQKIIQRISISQNEICLTLVPDQILKVLGVELKEELSFVKPMTLNIEATLRRAGKGKRLIITNAPPAEINDHLIELIKEAISVRQKLLSNPELCIESLTSQLDLYKGRITSLIKLSWLAPKIMRAILEGRQPLDLTPSRLLRLAKDLPISWYDQHRLLSIPA
ncbi:MAG: recombinase family protein [Methylocystaceae bacterium]|nr:recombinase family protein [Methylocystaceae bacterium]